MIRRCVVSHLRRQRDRLGAVAHRVDQQVGDDAIEHEAVGDDREIVRYVELDGRAGRQRFRDDLAQDARQHERRRLDADPTCVEARQVEQLLEQSPQALALLDTDSQQLSAQVLVQLPVALQQRRQDAVHGRGRRSQLVRRDRDEVRLQLIELHRLLVEPRTLDRKRDPVGDQLSAARHPRS